MTDCERLRRDAPGLAALPTDDPIRIAAWAHANGCAECARALSEAERLQALLAEIEPVPLSEGALDRVRSTIASELRREARRSVLSSALSACAGFLAFVAFARSRSHSAGDWGLALTMASLAVVLSATARRRASLAVGVTVVAALVAAALSGARGPLAPALGAECVATELVTAGMVVAAAWLALRSGTTVPARAAMVAAAGAGALAGNAALQITCGAHTSAPHLFVFHVGGVLLALAIVAALWRRPARAALA
jgi:hypothetical protein